MSTVEPYGDGPNYKPLIIIGVIVIAILFLLALKANAFERDEKPFTPVGSQYTAVKEPQVTVDRHVLNRSDYENDATILIAGQRVTPKFEVSEPKPAPAELIREVVPQANPMADVTIRATIESDDEAPVNYPL